jgi:hypothetical protein
MNQKDFILLDVAYSLLNAKEEPFTGRERKLAATHTATEVNFLIKADLLKADASARSTPLEKTVIRLSDLTEEGQDFVMSQGTVKWLIACDRKSNDMLKKGVLEEERLAIYADPNGLHNRLEKFRRDRAAKTN